ncbi:ABC transporter AbcH.1 [Rhizophlyctis rosea]|nr:ABC transporter AbcH.1 [Rhizophlyctis rosea]
MTQVAPYPPPSLPSHPISAPHFTTPSSNNCAPPESANNLGKSDPIVTLKNIHKTYLLGVEGVAALRGVSLQIQRGEWVVIYGTSGGGKTSLLNIIGTIDKPTKGELTVGDTVVRPNTADSVLADIRLNTLGFVFQSFNLISSMTALENVELPMMLKGVLPTKQRRKVATASLERVGLSHRLHHLPTKLSGGEQQRVTIARATANSPEILLLDEPTGDLDTANTTTIISLLHALNTRENMTLIMVTHDVYLKNFAHRVVYMRDGKVHRVEVVPESRRRVAVEELERRVGGGGGKEVEEEDGQKEVMPLKEEEQQQPIHHHRNQSMELRSQAVLEEGRPSGTTETGTENGNGNESSPTTPPPTRKPTTTSSSAPHSHSTIIPGAAEHTPGTWISPFTELRQPGDYATFSRNCGELPRYWSRSRNKKKKGDSFLFSI